MARTVPAGFSSLHGGPRALAFIIRAVAATLGVALLLVAAYYLAGELEHLRAIGFASFSVRDAAAALGIIALAFAGVLLVRMLPVPRRVRLRSGVPQPPMKPAYGFGTVLAVGIGSTLGSPLFLLIPLNILEYELVSIISLVLAAILSIAMAKNNSESYRVLKANGLSAVGGPAYVRVAVGTRSARYFISRFSMAIANTALAAYCMIIFVLFDFSVLPALLGGFGLTGLASLAVVVGIAILFGIWFVMNSIFERRYIRAIGRAQIAFTALLVAILVGQSVLLGSSGGWDFRGLLAFPVSAGPGWLAALLINTAYLYILFFGFQEIQALDLEAKDTSRVPVLSWFRRGYVMDKKRYFGIAMMATVVIAAAVNIFYALSVYAANPSPAELSASQIPALYVAGSVLGPPQELLTALAFMLATFTTFVPAFMAASRHIGSLGQDGFLPKGVGRASWALVLVSIVFLAVAGETFLVSITDFMVLVSLGLIALSAVWLRRNRRKLLERGDFLAVAVGVTCFAAAGALYAITPSVAVFGSLSIALAFLIYDVFELGSLGCRLFAAVLCILTYGLIVLYPARFPSPGLLPVPFLEYAVQTTLALRTGLLLGAVGLGLTFFLDLLVRRVTRTAETEAPEPPAPPTRNG